jgi:hypothetical protein
MVSGIPPAVVALLSLSAPLAAGEAPPAVEVKVTHRYLEAVCLNGTRLKPGERRWRLSVGDHSLAFTMRNDARPGVEPKGGAGVAVVSFAVEAGHKYEVEVRASATAFSSRVWERGEWKPVVRDRTTNRVVSGEPQWSDSGCQR